MSKVSLSDVFPLERFQTSPLFRFGLRHKTYKRDAKLKIREIKKKSR